MNILPIEVKKLILFNCKVCDAIRFSQVNNEMTDVNNNGFWREYYDNLSLPFVDKSKVDILQIRVGYNDFIKQLKDKFLAYSLYLEECKQIDQITIDKWGKPIKFTQFTISKYDYIHVYLEEISCFYNDKVLITIENNILVIKSINQKFKVKSINTPDSDFSLWRKWQIKDISINGKSLLKYINTHSMSLH
jgi:hypothetical protein